MGETGRLVYKIGIVGCGGVAQRHLIGYKYLENVQAIAAADVSERALKNMKDRWGIEYLYKDYKDLLRHDDIDIVDICVPEIAPGISDLHREVAVDVCNACKHALCEKPLAQSMEGAQAILAAARKTGVKFMIGQSARWEPANEAVKKLMELNFIGNPLALYMESSLWRPPEASWWPELEKFVILKICVHWIDLFHWWLKRYARRVFAVTNSSRSFNDKYKYKGEQNCMIILDYGDDCFGYQSYCCYSHGSRFYRFRIEGSDGTIEFDGRLRARNEKLGGWFEPDVCQPPFNEEVEELLRTIRLNPGLSPWASALELKKLIEAIEKDEEPVVSLEDNIGVLKTIFACYESAKTGEAVKIPREAI